MPNCQMRYKAGKLCFLLVCLLWLSGCGKEKAVFETDAAPVPAKTTESVQTEECVEAETAEAQTKETGLVNINTADAAGLMTLPGIGKIRAAAILEYRQQMGEFQTIEEIMNVKGIKTGIFSKISQLICVK